MNFQGFTMQNLLHALTLPGAATPAVKALIEAATALLGKDDAATLKEALADAKAENDEGHKRLQAKLAAAARR